MGPWDGRTPDPTRRGRPRESQGETDRAQSQVPGPPGRVTDVGCGDEDRATESTPPNGREGSSRGGQVGARSLGGARRAWGTVRALSLDSACSSSCLSPMSPLPCGHRSLCVGSLLTALGPYKSSDHSVRCPHGAVPVPWDTLCPTGGQREGGALAGGVPGSLSTRRGSSTGSALSINTQASWTPTASPRHTPLDPGAPAEAHPKRSGSWPRIHPQKHSQTHTLYSSVCHTRWVPIPVPAWDLGTSPFWSEPHLPPA